MNALIDSSSWITFIRRAAEAMPSVSSALREGSAGFCEPVWAELWSGAKGRCEEDFLHGLRRICHWLPVDSEKWRMSYDLRRKALRNGLHCPLADVLIVACADCHKAELIHQDKHVAALLEL